MKRALVSVSDKTGLIEFLKPLCDRGMKIVSTGGTLKYLQQHQVPVVDISSVTGFPEVLDGRVKTLHPFVHMGLLADQANPHHIKQLDEHQVAAFDLVVGNLYPFEKTALDPASQEKDLIENIDIGGPSFLRSSAKNYKSVVVVSDPDDYPWVLTRILENQLTIEDRKKLALKVFSLTSYYDALIVQKLSDQTSDTKYLNIPLKRKASLRYGENAHQKASWFENPLSQLSLSQAQFHQGKELSYNNILDLDASTSLVRLFSQPACVAVKHNNPCGVAQGKTLEDAVRKTIDADPKSIFGGILAFNREMDLRTCQLLKDIFLECLIAPSFSAEALEFLKSKKNLRVLTWPALSQFHLPDEDSMKSVFGGVLKQTSDRFDSKEWKTHGETPSEDLRQDMEFGEKVCAYLKSNAIALVYNGQTVGLGMGQVNRVDAVKQAFTRLFEYKKNHDVEMDRVVLISDAFFPFADSIEIIAAEKVKWILQPGGSVKDAEVIQAALNNNMSITMSHQRHFRH